MATTPSTLLLGVYRNVGLTGSCSDYTGSAPSDSTCSISTTDSQQVRKRRRSIDISPYGNPKLEACPIPWGDYKCVNLEDELESCGACGRVCSSKGRVGVRSVGCQSGRCVNSELGEDVFPVTDAALEKFLPKRDGVERSWSM